MLKLATNSSSSGCPARQPTKFFESQTFYGSDNVVVRNSLATYKSNGASGNKLKLSAVAKVPSSQKGKVNCNQPVAEQDSTTGTPMTILSARSDRSPAIVCARPTSLALRNSSALGSASMIPAKVSSSIVPKFTLASSRVSAAGAGVTTATKVTDRKQPKQENAKVVRSQVGTKRKLPVSGTTAAATQATSSATSMLSEPRSSGLKNLVAVVHPQKSQRVNSSAPTASSLVNKPTSTTSKTHKSVVPKLAAKASANSTKESGKFNFNHKDVNGVDRECKQDASRTGARPTRISPTNNTTSPMSMSVNKFNSSSRNNVENKKGGISFLSTNSTVTNRQIVDKNDQFALQSRRDEQVVAAAASNGSSKTADKFPQLPTSTTYDCNLHNGHAHRNNEQSTDELSSSPLRGEQISPRPVITSVCDGHEVGDQIGLRPTMATATDVCYNHDRVDLASQKALTAMSFRGDINSHAINDRIRPKPMGHQVLSLMMLDVGLMPANSHQPPQASQPKCSHVQLQSSFQQDTGVISRLSASSHLYGNDYNQSISGHGETRSNSNLASICRRNINDYQEYEQCSSSDYHSLQPVHEALRLQLRFSNQDNENSRSISLPTSPRIGVRGLIDYQANKNNHRMSQRVNRHDDPFNHANPLHDELRARLGLAALQKGRVRNVQHDQSLATCDNQDSQSIASSSSCSSLNHCPPLLTLSNQLNGLKFDELVKLSRDGCGVSAGRFATERTCDNPTMEKTDKTNQNIVPSGDQLAQVARQHRLLTSDLDSEDKHWSPKAEARCPKVVAQSSESSPDSSHGSSRETPSRNESRCIKLRQKDVRPTDESRSSQQLRRQQQSRSHSISGQDFHSNGGYQRMKQSLFNQHGIHDANQRHIVQNGAQPHHLLSPYRELANLDRSPSPGSLSSQHSYGYISRDGMSRNMLEKQQRNPLHTSLECLTSGYTEQQHQIRQQQLLNQQHQLHQLYQQRIHVQQHQHQHQQQLQHQHYATGYVLAAPPPNTIINQSGEHDLAAAAMGAPSQYHVSNGIPAVSSSSNQQQTQSLISRAVAQMNASPLRRIGLNAISTSGAPSGIVQYQQNSNQSIRAGHSSLSLTSSSFIIEDKLQNEIKKLHSELKSEKEKNDALSSQLNINSSLMAAFEQSLTTLNTRLRQLTTLNEKKDNEIEELRSRLMQVDTDERSDRHFAELPDNIVQDQITSNTNSDIDSVCVADLKKTIEDLRKQLIEKDRQLTDTRLEALSAAHQLEQLEARMNGENSLMGNEDDLDEGVMVVNNSPSDSDAITDSAHFSEINNKVSQSNQKNSDNSFTHVVETVPSDTNNTENQKNLSYNLDSIADNNTTDNRSSHSSEFHLDEKTGSPKSPQTMSTSISQQFDERDSGVDRLMDSLLLT